jgi:hypothetical protein
MIFFKVLGRLTVRFLNWLGRSTVGTVKAASHHLITTLLVVVILGGIIFAGFQTNGFGLASSQGNFSIDATDPLSPSQASADFLKGLFYQDGQQIWNSLSSHYQGQLTAQGLSPANIQKLMQNQVASFKQQGVDFAYLKMVMQNQTDLANSSSLESYVTVFRVGNNIGEAGVNLLLDKDRKVDLVQTDSSQPEPLVNAVFNKQQTQANASSTPSAGGQQAAEGQVSGQDSAKSATDFMQAATNFDAVKLWDTLAPAFQKQLESSGVTEATIQKTFDDAKSQYKQQKVDLSYQGFALQQAINFTNSRTLSQFLSVITLQGQVHTFNYDIFTDVSGKVTSITATDPILGTALKLQGSSSSGQ